MKKICFITGSRADYGIMAPLMKKVKAFPEIGLQIIATNTHVSTQFGKTVNEIKEDGFAIDALIESSPKGDSPADTSEAMARTLSGIGEALASLKPDIIVILGDRYEALAAASAAVLFNIQVAHLHGGEITKGAYDDAFRNAITKLSSLHFPSTELYAKRIIDMGVDPDKVVNVGALGVENILESELIGKNEIEKFIDFDLGQKFFLVTFHPATKEPGEETSQTSQLIDALETFRVKGWKFLITLPNSDTGYKKVLQLLTDWELNYPNQIKTVSSLGRMRYFSAIALSSAVIGNSSSGIIEVPAFFKPTINIGNRQEGRMTGPSIINVGNNKEEIISAIEQAINPDFINFLSHLSISEINPYYQPSTSDIILKRILKEL